MDTITHAILGALVGRSTAPRTQAAGGLTLRQRTVAGALAAAFPDIDILTLWIDPYSYLTQWHRGPTHSLILLPLWALLLSLLFAAVARRPGQWRDLFVVCALAILSHVLLDVITIFGTIVFSPVSDYRAAVGTTFIIDPWVTAVLLAALVVSLVRKSGVAARAGIALLFVMVGFHGLMKLKATTIGEQYVLREGLQGARVLAFPQPLSPFNWLIAVVDGEDYRVARVDLVASAAARPDAGAGFLRRLQSGYRPVGGLRWRRLSKFGDPYQDRSLVATVWSEAAMAPYRRFAALPRLYRIDRGNPRTCVWFTDVRYELPGMTPPFRYGMCRGETPGDWRLSRLGRLGDDDVSPAGSL